MYMYMYVKPNETMTLGNQKNVMIDLWHFSQGNSDWIENTFKKSESQWMKVTMDDRYTNLFLNAYINRHAHTEY